MLNFNAKIIVDAREKTKAIFDSVKTDHEFYPENHAKVTFILTNKMEIVLNSEHLPHIRANLNSTLRLIQASYNSISSVKV